MYIQDPIRIAPMLKVVFALAAADPSVDMRDRIRVFRALFPVDGKPSAVKHFGDAVVLCAKPEPKLPSPAMQTCEHALGSLSHFMDHMAPGYTPLAKHPTVQPPTNVREQYFAGGSGREGSSAIAVHNGKSNGLGASGFYSSSDDSDDSDSDSSSYTGSDDSDDSSDDSGDSSDDDEDEDDESDDSSSSNDSD
jgi:hypothetical protein